MNITHIETAIAKLDFEQRVANTCLEDALGVLRNRSVFQFSLDDPDWFSELDQIGSFDELTTLLGGKRLKLCGGEGLSIEGANLSNLLWELAKALRTHVILNKPIRTPEATPIEHFEDVDQRMIFRASWPTGTIFEPPPEIRPIDIEARATTLIDDLEQLFLDANLLKSEEKKALRVVRTSLRARKKETNSKLNDDLLRQVFSIFEKAFPQATTSLAEVIVGEICRGQLRSAAHSDSLQRRVRRANAPPT